MTTPQERRKHVVHIRYKGRTTVARYFETKETADRFVAYENGQGHHARYIGLEIFDDDPRTD